MHILIGKFLLTALTIWKLCLSDFMWNTVPFLRTEICNAIYKQLLWVRDNSGNTGSISLLRGSECKVFHNQHQLQTTWDLDGKTEITKWKEQSDIEKE